MALTFLRNLAERKRPKSGEEMITDNLGATQASFGENAPQPTMSSFGANVREMSGASKPAPSTPPSEFFGAMGDNTGAGVMPNKFQVGQQSSSVPSMPQTPGILYNPANGREMSDWRDISRTPGSDGFGTTPNDLRRQSGEQNWPSGTNPTVPSIPSTAGSLADPNLANARLSEGRDVGAMSGRAMQKERLLANVSGLTAPKQNAYDVVNSEMKGAGIKGRPGSAPGASLLKRIGVGALKGLAMGGIGGAVSGAILGGTGDIYRKERVNEINAGYAQNDIDAQRQMGLFKELNDVDKDETSARLRQDYQDQQRYNQMERLKQMQEANELRQMGIEQRAAIADLDRKFQYYKEGREHEIDMLKRHNEALKTANQANQFNETMGWNKNKFERSEIGKTERTKISNQPRPPQDTSLDYRKQQDRARATAIEAYMGEIVIPADILPEDRDRHVARELKKYEDSGRLSVDIQKILDGRPLNPLKGAKAGAR